MRKILLAVFIAGTGLVVFLNRAKLRNRVVEVNRNVDIVKETIIPQPTKISEVGLPDRHLIETAFIEQAPEKNWDQPWQDACEEASLLTVNYYYQSVKPDLNQVVADLTNLFEFETKQGYTHDVNLAQMADISQKMWGYNSEVLQNPTVEQIKKYLSQDIPVIAPANGKILFRENKKFKNGGPWYHNLVILGYDDNKKIFIVHDVGTQYGAYFRYSYDTLLESIHDFPQSGKKEDINSGEKSVLILIK